MLGLAIAYLRDRLLVTVLNVLLLALAVATLVILLLFSTQLGDRFERDARGIDLVVGAKGSPLQLILSSVYHVDTPTGNIPLAAVELLRRDPGVARVVPLALGDNFRGFRVVGTEPAYLDLHAAKLAQGRVFNGEGEAVVGADVARRTGMGLGQRFLGTHGLGSGEGTNDHDEHPFTAVGILAPTGTVADRLILVSVESVWDAHGIAHGEAGHDKAGQDGAGQDGAEHGEAGHDHHDGDEHAKDAAATGPQLAPEVTALLVSYRSAFGAVRVPAFVNAQPALQAAVPAVETTRLLSLFGVGIDAARLFAWLLAATGGLSIFVALLSAANAREGDLALLRVIGATRASVFGTVLIEGLATAAAGAVLGVALGHAALAVAAASFAPLGEIGVDPLAFVPGELSIVAAVLGIGVVAALIPAIRVFGTDPAAVLARAA